MVLHSCASERPWPPPPQASTWATLVTWVPLQRQPGDCLQMNVLKTVGSLQCACPLRMCAGSKMSVSADRVLEFELHCSLKASFALEDIA